MDKIDIDERAYRERLMGELWRYGHVMGTLGQVEVHRGCIWSDLGCISALNDVCHLAARLPRLHEEGMEEKILALLTDCRTPLIRDFPPEDVYALMKLAAGEPTTVALYGRVPSSYSTRRRSSTFAKGGSAPPRRM